ncbi:bacterial transcriptional activator domain-containing protein [Streptomyces aureus]
MRTTRTTARNPLLHCCVYTFSAAFGSLATAAPPSPNDGHAPAPAPSSNSSRSPRPQPPPRTGHGHLLARRRRVRRARQPARRPARRAPRPGAGAGAASGLLVPHLGRHAPAPRSADGLDRRRPRGATGGSRARLRLHHPTRRRARRVHGELLPEDRYAPWTDSRRERLAVVCERLRITLAEALLDEDAADEAATVARSALDENPADERAHQLLMSAYLRQGLRRQAVRQFHACREALDSELGVRPGPRTQRLHLLALDAGGAAAPVARPAAGFTPPGAVRGPAPAPLRGVTRSSTGCSRRTRPPYS